MNLDTEKLTGLLQKRYNIPLRELNHIYELSEAQTAKGGQAEVRVIPKIAWANEKPKTVGLYFRTNPVLQHELSEQIVFKLDGELWTYHPHNETSKKTKIKDMPNSFWWIQIPIPEHWKVKLDYDKR